MSLRDPAQWQRSLGDMAMRQVEFQWTLVKRREHDSAIPRRKALVQHVAVSAPLVGEGVSNFRCSIAWRNECAASSSRVASGRRGFRASAPGLASLPGLDCTGPTSLSTDKCFQDLARGRPMAPKLLPYLRRGTCHGPANRRRSRSLATTLLRLLRDALAIPANRMPVLRKGGRSSSLCDSNRGREIPSHRLLPVLPRLSEDL